MNKINPVILISGAARNTGFAIAKRFAKEGYNVCITSRNKKSAEDAAKKIEQEYPDIIAKGYGMASAEIEDIRKTFSDVKHEFGKLDVFVANATTPGYNQNILNSTPEDFDYVINSNLKAYFFCSQEAAKIMTEQKKGNIILIGSVHSKGALPNRILYGMTKCAIDGMHRSIAYELAKYNIRCNCIVAGAIWNDRWEGLTEEELQLKRDNWPVGRESYPEDIANAAYFLSSDQSETITGIDLVVDSGVTACLLNYNKKWEEQ
jgi:NAD(P)-dependent dehydrogenase (short-subunit alcohol dehydrogenase family)